jgi:hypothetical protein
MKKHTGVCASARIGVRVYVCVLVCAHMSYLCVCVIVFAFYAFACARVYVFVCASAYLYVCFRESSCALNELLETLCEHYCTCEYNHA